MCIGVTQQTEAGPLYNTLDTDEESETSDIKCAQPSATVTILKRNVTRCHVASSEYFRMVAEEVLQCRKSAKCTSGLRECNAVRRRCEELAWVPIQAREIPHVGKREVRGAAS